MTNALNQFKREDHKPQDVSRHYPLPVTDYWLEHAAEVIYHTYGDQVSVGDKAKDLLKYGRNPIVQTTKSTIMDLPSGIQNETYLTDNLITTVSSTSGSDTEQITLEGHTVDGSGDFTFVIQTISLTGQTQATLTTALARCSRVYNSDSTELVGTVYTYEDDTSTAGVPDTAAGVHCIIPAGKQQSRKCATTLSSTDYWIIPNINAAILKKTAAAAEFDIEIRLKGKVFRPYLTFPATNGTEGGHNFLPYLIVPPNSDVRIIGIADTNNTDCSAHIDGILATVV